MNVNSEAIRKESMLQYGFGVHSMKNIKVCPSCGAVNRAKGIRCVECRMLLSKETIFQIYKCRNKVCPNCETVLAESMRYCPQCGVKLHCDIDNV